MYATVYKKIGAMLRIAEPKTEVSYALYHFPSIALEALRKQHKRINYKAHTGEK